MHWLLQLRASSTAALGYELVDKHALVSHALVFFQL
jgi:hypothetical protein